MRTLTAVITAGGTRVPIDDVRSIGNLSKGRFPWQIALALGRRGVRVTVVGSESLFQEVGGRLPENIGFRAFGTYDQLRTELAAALERERPDLLFMAAAVSDYGPAEKAAGKIPSDGDELVIRLRRLPKILDGLRASCGKETFIVGFKLTSGDPDGAVRAAREQIARCRINLSIANDLSTFGNGRHPVVMVTPEGGALPVDGTREDVAGRIADFALMRADTTWCRSENVDAAALKSSRPAFERASGLLALAQEMSLFGGTEGNVSAADRSTGTLWVTPRGAKKSAVGPTGLINASVDLDRRVVAYAGGAKPSIDTSVQARLYAELPGMASFLHVHGAFCAPDAATEREFPCGSQEEAEEICRALAKAAVRGFDAKDGFAVELSHHGFLFGLAEGGPERMREQWRAAIEAYKAHLDDIGEPAAIERLTLVPVFASTRIVGVIARHPEGWISPFLLPAARGAGMGPDLLRMIRDRRLVVAAHDRCEVIRYYVERAFRQKEKRGGLAILEPPTLRHDLTEAATACLWHPPSGKILLVRRATSLWNELWCHPGGRMEPGESAECCALRELKEEAGIRPAGSVIATHETCTETAGKAFRVRSFLYAVPDMRPPAIDGREVDDAGWFTVQDALSLPMGHGTKEIIREFMRHMR